jgi:methionyl-tRNA synthetase
VRYNSELANNLGNLVNRTLNMTTRFAGGVVPAQRGGEDLEKACGRTLGNGPGRSAIPLCEGYQFHTALERVMEFLTETNAYIEKRAPLASASRPKRRTRRCCAPSLATMAESLRLAVALLQHVTPATTRKDQRSARLHAGRGLGRRTHLGNQTHGAKVAEALVLFPRPAPPEKAPAPCAPGVSAGGGR